MLLRLDVVHRGRAMMVGKIFELATERIFLHETGGGSQYHWNLNCPAGIDTLALEFLLAERVTAIHVFDRARGRLYMTTPQAVAAHGALQVSGGRERKYLAVDEWVVRENAALPYTVPYVRAVHTLGIVAPRGAQSPVLKAPTPGSAAIIYEDILLLGEKRRYCHSCKRWADSSWAAHMRASHAGQTAKPLPPPRRKGKRPRALVEREE